MRLAVCLIICLSFSFSVCQGADIDIVRPEPSYPTETENLSAIRLQHQTVRPDRSGRCRKT